MNDQTRSTTTLQDNSLAAGNMTHRNGSRRQSVGLVELKHHPRFENVPNGGEDEEAIGRPSSEEDLLQFFLAIESSRQEMETYTRYLDTVMRQNSQARMEAEAAARLKSDFMATMSTEMRTPLIGLVGLTNALLSRPLAEFERDYVETIRQTCQALRAVMDDVLDLSKIDAGKLRLDRDTFDLLKCISNIIDHVKTTAVKKGLTIQFHNDPRVPQWIRGDAARIGQIVSNLLTNAVKFTETGTIEIRTRVQSIDRDECELIISVKDEGVGIRDEQQSVLFTPSGHSGDSAASKYVGSGIGLAICKQLAELMGGQLGVSSRYGEGSLFWFSVRVQVVRDSDRDLRPEEAASKEPKATKPAQILLVGADCTDQKDALLALESLGYSADVAQNGAEALLALESAHYDLVLMNSMMPEMNGFETARRLRSLSGCNTEVPIIGLLGQEFEGDRVACLSAGMNDFLAKPIDQADLAAKAAFWLVAGKTFTFEQQSGR